MQQNILKKMSESAPILAFYPLVLRHMEREPGTHASHLREEVDQPYFLMRVGYMACSQTSENLPPACKP